MQTRPIKGLSQEFQATLSRIRAAAFGLTLAASVFFPDAAHCGALTSDPLWDWKYDAVERLSAAYGLSGQFLSNLRPVSRMELAKVTAEIIKKQKVGEGAASGNWHQNILLDRLKKDLASELGRLGEGNSPEKENPLRWVRMKGELADYPALLYNDYGYKAQTSGVKMVAGLGWENDRFAFEVRPELGYFSGSGTVASLHSGFLVARFGNFEIQAGKDSMWWGPGRNGSNILTNNAPAFNMVKMSTAEPSDLWLMGNTKFVLFIGEVGAQNVSMMTGNAAQYASYVETRNPVFAGFRLDFAPLDFLEIGVSHTITATNRVGEQYKPSDLLDLVYPDWQKNEDAAYQGLVSNHLQSVDISLVFDRSHSFVRQARLESFKFYVEYGGEAVYVQNHILPYLQFPQLITGLYFDWGAVDLRVEYLKNSPKVKWYTHGQFTSGYTNDGIIMGHHAGGFAKDLYMAASCGIDENWRGRAVYEHIIHFNGVDDEQTDTQDSIGPGLDYVGGPLGDFKFDYEARRVWDGLRTTQNNIFIIEWERGF